MNNKKILDPLILINMIFAMKQKLRSEIYKVSAILRAQALGFFIGKYAFS